MLLWHIRFYFQGVVRTVSNLVAERNKDSWKELQKVSLVAYFPNGLNAFNIAA